MTLQIIRDWVMKFNAHGPGGLIDRKPPGQAPRLNGVHRAALAAIIESGPIPAVHGVVRWRIIDLCQGSFEEFRVVVAKQTLSREPRALVIASFSERLEAIGREKDVEPSVIEAWFTDEARVGQKNKITRPGPSAARVQALPKMSEPPRLMSLARAVPRAARAQPVMPRCDTEAMNLHLAEIATQIAPGAHAVLLVDQAGWHLSGRLIVPPNITLIPFPAKEAAVQGRGTESGMRRRATIYRKAAAI